jgi:hypothetical protein
MTVFPGSIRQNAYIIEDLDAAIAEWVRMGIGPWFTIREMTQHGLVYRGAETAPTLSIGFANSGELQIELIQQHDDGPSVYREFLDAGGRGFHHIAFWTDEFDATMAAATNAGYPTVCEGNAGGVTKFGYVDAGGFSSTVVEVMELNDATRWMGTTIRDAAIDWDGTDPIRSLM